MIRTSLFASLIFLLITTVTNAQFHAGAKAGVNIGKLDGKSFKDEFSYSYLLGGFMEIGLGNRVSINPELLFSQTNATIENNVGGIFNSNQLKTKLNYLAIPILVNVRVAGPLHLEAGPQFGILLNNDKSLVNNGVDAFKKGDFSMTAGAGFNFNILRVSARYIIGLTNISNLPDKDEWKNQAIQVGLGVAF